MVCVLPSKLVSVAHDSLFLDGSKSVRTGDGRHVYSASHSPHARRPSLKRGSSFDQEDRKVDGILQRQKLVRDGHRKALKNLLSEVCGLRGV